MAQDCLAENKEISIETFVAKNALTIVNQDSPNISEDLIALRYRSVKPTTLQRFRIRAIPETSKGSETHARFEILISRFANSQNAKKIGVCPKVKGNSKYGKTYG